MKRLFFIFILLNFFTESIAQQPLHQSFKYPIGFAIDPKLIRENEVYKLIVEKHSNSITCENMMKSSHLQAQKGVFTFDEADFLVDFAQKTGKRVHGHTLVWYHSMSPEWMKSIKDSATLELALKTHIQTVVRHFKGKVKSWDVVNEAFTDDTGKIRTDSMHNTTRKAMNVGKILGADYIARMFKYAHEADPDALLFYNDYGQENRPMKQKAIIDMANDFKKRGIPIHGIGLQMHTHSWIDLNKIEKVIKETAETGLLVHISELDVVVNKSKSADYEYTSEEQTKQAVIFKTVVEAYNKFVPPIQRYGITIWNVGDTDSAQNVSFRRTNSAVREYPLLFDKNYQLKKVLWAAFGGVF
jgi:endo-1,4-beta-xylanase